MLWIPGDKPVVIDMGRNEEAYFRKYRNGEMQF